jgi:hypothetical protein
VTSKEMLDKLLEPITWSWSSSIRARQNLVESRREKVTLVLPFLSEEDTSKANKWLSDNKHSGLWD